MAVEKKTIPELPGVDGSLVSLEHFSVNVGVEWNEDLQTFWFEILEAGEDTRVEEILKRQTVDKFPLHWANFGLQQAHLPCVPGGSYENMQGLKTWTNTQKIRGFVGLEWPAESFCQLVHRLETCDSMGSLSSAGGLKILAKTDEMVEFTASYGNGFRVTPVKESHYIGPKFPLPADTTKCLPGPRSIGLGIRYMEYFVPRVGNILRCIAETYEVVLGAKIRRSADQNMIEVAIGIKENPQFIRFAEKDEVGPYEGDHFAIYVNDFLPMYGRAKQVRIGGQKSDKTVSIVWNNPVLTMKYDTLEQVKQLNEFRFKDFLDLNTGEVVYQLEHEVRSLAHPGFQVNKETFL